jgi:hypothetical protein
LPSKGGKIASEKENKQHRKTENQDTDVLDIMITSLAELFEEKGVIA